MLRFLLINIFFGFYLTTFSQDQILVSPYITVDGEKILTSKIPQFDVIDFRSNEERKSFFKLKGDKLRFATDKIEKMISLRQAA